ncbi:MAG: transporter substrate-binding domain-containing protein [Acholeplasmataceae bacterium]|nr:transporter substrate-binding domain-containing protein [Acholeplasmataceae bacterium]
MIQITKKIIIVMFIIFIAFVVDLNLEVEGNSNSVVYLSAAEYDYPPFSIENNGQPDGFSVQLLKAVAIEMGITIEFKMDYWSVIKQELIDGKLDVLPLVGYTIERDEVLDFTVPYIVMRGNIFVRDGDNAIQSVDDLYGKEVLVLSGDNSEEYAKSIGLDNELTATSTYTEAFKLLSSGQYDAVLAQGLVGEKIIFDENLSNITPVYVFDDDGISKTKLNLEGYEQKFCFAVTEDNDELLSILNEGLSIVSANGTYDALYQIWFPFLIDNKPTLKDVLGISLYVLVPLIVITLISAIFIIKKQVKEQTSKIVKSSLSNQIILEAFEKKFQSDSERYAYFLRETLKLSDSKDGIMFTRKSNGKIAINAVEFDKINPNCTLKEMEIQIEKILESIPSNNQTNQLIFNDLDIENQFESYEMHCLNGTKRAILLSFYTDSKDLFYTIIANKPSTYSNDDLTQISILISGFVSMIDRSNYLKQIEYLSYHDSLTGLFNRRYFEDQLKELNHKKNHPIAILFADVNKLKEVNDHYGHLKGDQLLKEAAKLFNKLTENHDVVVRWGGDEFVILKFNSKKEDAEKFIEQMTLATKELNLGFGDISIALGYAIKQDFDSNIIDAMIEAEEMMYQSKRLDT